MCEGDHDPRRDDSSRDRAPDEGVGTDGGVIALGEVLDCLTSSRRRHILYYLQEHEVVDVDELATQIASREGDIPPQEVTSDHHERIATSLVHTHLPKLADTELIEYDRRSNAIRYANSPSILDKILQLLAQLENEQRA